MKKLRKIIFCTILNWHQVEKTGTDGYKEIGRCKHCDRVMFRKVDELDDEWKLRDGRTTLERIIDFIKLVLIFVLFFILINFVKGNR